MKRVKKFKIAYFLSCIVFFLSTNLVNAQSASKSLKLGKNAYYNFHYEEAISHLTQGVEKFSDDNNTNADLYYFLAKAVYYNSRVDYRKSLSLLDKAIMYNPEFSQAYFLKAKITKFENDNDEVVFNNYKKVLELLIDSDLWPYWDGDENDILLVGVSLLNVSGKQEALSFYGRGINRIDPLSVTSRNIKANYYYLLSVIYSETNENKKALEALDKALKKGLKILDYYYLFIDLYNLRDEDEFERLMFENNVPGSYYNTIPTATLQIERYVQRKINLWQKKGKFEKTTDYQMRVTPQTRLKKVDYYTQAAIDSIGISTLRWNRLTNDYDADNESFKIAFPKLEPIFVNVPINEARSFDKNFHNLEFNNIVFTLKNDLSTSILHLEITNSEIGKTYIYDSQNDIAYSSTSLNLNFDEIEIPLDKHTASISSNQSDQTTKIIEVGKSDVDTNIPVTKNKSKNTYALIIGNEDYTKYQTGLSSESNVDFAIRDAEIFAEYAEKTLGIPKENITVLKNAISSQMQREINKTSKIAMYHNGEANIIFYYAGHGFPDDITKESYLMPVDVSATDVTYGIKLNYLYQQLTKYPSQKVLVILDACFSGGGRNQGLLAARGVKIKPKENVINGNLVVFTSSSDEQSSLPYANKQHGMFTYFLLKKLKESNGNITLEELSDYVTKEVQISALKINSKEQNPKILVSPDVGNLWMDWKLN